jgi:hypothetical protein
MRMSQPFTKLGAAVCRTALKVCGLALVLAALSGQVQAGGGGFPPPSPAPEIDPGSMRAALMLLGGGILLMADRFRRSSR